jgi:hypothetical protein
MSIDTKGFIYGIRKEGFSLENLVEYIKEVYNASPCVEVEKDSVIRIHFNYSNKNRFLWIFTNYKSYKTENYLQSIKDSGEESIILFSLGCWGNSVKIMKNIISFLGGGYILNNDCSGEWYEIAPQVLTASSISPYTKIMCSMGVSDKEAYSLYENYVRVKEIMDRKL